MGALLLVFQEFAHGCPTTKSTLSISGCWYVVVLSCSGTQLTLWSLGFGLRFRCWRFFLVLCSGVPLFRPFLLCCASLVWVVPLLAACSLLLSFLSHSRSSRSQRMRSCFQRWRSMYHRMLALEFISDLSRLSISPPSNRCSFE